MPSPPLLTLAFLFSCLNLSAQGAFTRALDSYALNYLPEKVFVHTDKSIYAGGETIWAAVYLVDGQTHVPDSLSSVIHLELHAPSGKMVQKRKLYPYDGHTAGDLTLPAGLTPGDYQLTAYTNYQRNSGEQSLFRKTIRIVSGLKESGGVAAPSPMPTYAGPATSQWVNLRFFPEGGDCVAGIPCRVAVVAEDDTGLPLALLGFLNDPTGKSIATFLTEENGIGFINYTPESNTPLTAVAGAERQRFYLPSPLDRGTNLTVNQRTDTVQVLLNSNLPAGLEGTTVLLHQRGIPLLERKLNSSREQFSLLLPINIIPPGVVTATIFDANNQPVAERLFFVGPDDTNLEIGLKQNTFGTRAPVDLSIKMPVSDGVADSLAGGRISLSVLPAASAGGPSGDDLRSWLLLNSDLDRPVPNAPELVFGKTEQARGRKIDEYLLTREWRRFRWKALLNELPSRPKYLIEEGIYLRGRMTKLEYRNSARPGKIFLTRLDNSSMVESLTDEEGHFIFGPYTTLFDTIDVSVQGRFKPGKRNRLNPEIDLDDNNVVSLAVAEPKGPTLPPAVSTKAATKAAPYEEISRKTLTVARTYDSLIIDLQTIDVATKRIDPIKEKLTARGALYVAPDARVIVDSLPGAFGMLTFLDLIRRVSGVTIIGNGAGSTSILIRGVSSVLNVREPLLILDGIPVSIRDMLNVQPMFIEFVDVLKGPKKAIYGSEGAGGVILVYTKTGDAGRGSEPGLISATINGYHRVREFAVFDPNLPDYRNRPDYRTTLHWNADLRTNRKGIAKDQLLTSDQVGKFFIIAQGLRSDGKPFFGLGEFLVEE